KALDSFLDTPKKGHNPKNLDRTILFTIAITINIVSILFTPYHPDPSK
ncbi:unnamed protein product, partial [marine sediment metagenome]